MDIGKLREKCKETGFRPDKRLGQNFLIDGNIRDKILGKLDLDKQTVVLEIGPGFGMMTGHIAGEVKKVYAVEKDAEICRIMSGVFSEKGNIDFVNSDFMDADIDVISKKENTKLLVYGNIPYNMTAPIIQKVIDSRGSVMELWMVIQDEVASRLSAEPGSKIYGSLSCYAQFYARVRRHFKISRNCFFPKPMVESCLVSLDFRGNPFAIVENEEMMFSIIREAFSRRRKKVLNPFSSDNFMGIDKEGWNDIFTSAGVDPSLRAEDIHLEQYARISDEAGKALRNKDHGLN